MNNQIQKLIIIQILNHHFMKSYWIKVRNIKKVGILIIMLIVMLIQ